MLIILIHNDGTGTDRIGNYTYEVRINQKVIENGDITGHVRKNGWRELVHKLMDRSEKSLTDE
jgi:hypothetical protein